MTRQDTSVSKHALLLLVLAGLLPAQTTINVNSTVLQNPVKRFGINLGTPNFYDSGQMTKNLVYTTNPSFEGEIYQSLIQCNGSGTANSCADVNVYAGFTNGFWNNASYQIITGTAAGRSGTICSFSPPVFPQNGGVYTFCDSGTVPAYGDYMLVKTTMPPDVGWPIGGDWLTTVGGGTFTAETNDLPPGTLGKQSGLLSAPTGSDSVSVNMFFDSTTTKSFVQLNGSYVLTFKAKGVSGNKNVGVSLTRGGNTFFNQTQALTSSWATYTINFTGNENGSALTKVKLAFAANGPDAIEIDDISLTKSGTDPTNTTIFRDEVVQALQGANPGVLRYWVDQLGDSLDNLLASSTGRQRSGYTPYAGFDGTNITLVGGIPSIGTYQTQSLKVGLTEFLQLCQKVGADPWIVVPSTFSTGEAYNLMDYLAGGSGTPYGAIRIASGQTAPWTSVFNVIHLEFGNEEWNGGTFKGGALETGTLSYSPYGVRAQAIFTSIKGNAGYSQSKFDLIINGQSSSPFSNYFTQLSINNNDSFSIAPYMMYNINEWATIDHLFGTTFAEAEAFVTPNASAEGVTGGFITTEQNPVSGPGKPIVTSEMNLSPTGTPPSGGDGPMSQAAMDGYGSSVGAGIAVLDSMFQQLRAGVLTQNLFALPGYTVATQTGTSSNLWGAVVDMGVTNRKRPQYLALQMANNAIGNKTHMIQTQHTGLDPTDNQYNFALNSVTLPTFHFLQSFAFTDGSGNYSLVVFNVSPDFPQSVNFGGIVPTGTVNVQQLTSAQITDTNENSNLVNIQSIPFAATMTLPAYSMTTFTWGGSVQAGPAITNVATSGITSNSATITWTTDQPSTSQVNYGTTTSYGLQSALNSTLVTSHSVTLTGLTPGTTYDFDVASTNSSNASTTSPNATFATPGAAPAITNVTATAITANSATITWTTDQPASSQVNYGLTATYGSSSTLNSTLVTSHSVTLTGLTGGTTYNYDVFSANGSSQSTTSGNFTFATTAQGPAITAVTATAITTTGATITWTTDQPSSSLVNYGTTSSYGSASTLNTTLVTSHSVVLTGLTPGTTYNYDVVSANASSISSTSPNATFATPTAQAPAITAVSATNITATGATINWTTDLTSSSQVNYGTTSSYGSSSTLNSTLVTTHSVVLTGLTGGTTYNYDVVSVTGASGSATSANFTFNTTAAPAPVISAITVTGITPTGATVNWTTDIPSSSLVNYGLTATYGSASTLDPTLVTTHSVTLTGLTGGTTYNFDVVSKGTGTATGTSPNGTFATAAAGAPVISSVSAYPVGNSTASINWVTDVNATSVVNYGLTPAYGQQATLGAATTQFHSLPLSGLSPGTTYHFSVTSANAANVSASSVDSNFTTSGTAAAPVISGVTVSAITAGSATISWATDQAASTQVAYGLTSTYGSTSTLVTALTTAHSVTLTGLTAGTTYNFSAISANISGMSAGSANATFITTSAAPVISAVTATAITSSTATITWTTDQPTSSQVNYGLTGSYGLASSLNTTLVTSHSVTLTGLTPSTLYNYDVISNNAANMLVTSPNFTFTTTVATPPVISAVTATPISATSATITWTTDQPSNSLVNYGLTATYGLSSTLNSNLVTSHSVTLTGLTQNTTYNFDVVSGYATGTPTTSANGTFTTPQTPPVISAVTATSITSTSAIITWTTDQASNSLVNYGLTATYGSQSSLTPLVTSHSVTLTGLTPATTYNFDVVSGYATGTPSTSANATFSTLAPPPPVISAVTATGITSTSATITWTTDQPSTSLVNYGLTSGYGLASTLNSSLVTSHSVTLSGLTPGTTYNFDVVSGYATGTPSTSGNFTFNTAAQTPPVISAVQATSITATSAVITWTTDQASTSLVNYGLTSGYGTASTLNSTLVTSHSVTLTGLTQHTTYNFDVVSGYATGTPSSSSNFTFATLQTPPVISAVQSTSITATSAVITWTTDQPSNSLVNYGTTATYGLASTLNSTLVTSHSVTLTGLSQGTTYNFDVVSGYATGTPSTSANFTFATTQNPPVISAVTATPVSPTSVTISWTTDQASNSLVNYGTTQAYGLVSQNSTMVTSHSVTLTGLTQNTTYNYDVVSGYATGTPTTSANATFTTSQVPPVISAVQATSITATSAVITWTTDQPSNSQVNYGTTAAYGLASTLNSTLVTSHSVTLTGLTQGTTYNYDVVSGYATGTPSNSSNFTFATTQNPPVISAVVATPVSPTSVTITWTTDQASNSTVNYGATQAYGLISQNSTLVTSHSVTLTGLTQNTTYNFDVVSGYATGTPTTSANATFTTPQAPPVISAVQATNVTATTATITWTTDQASNSLVNYGTTALYGTQSTLISTLTTSHSVTLTGLAQGTTFNFDVVSGYATGTPTTSGNFTFTTTQNPPVISAVQSTPQSTTATITWTTDQPSTSLVNYGLSTGYGSQSVQNNTLVTNHSVTISGLTVGTTYNFDVVSGYATGTPTTSGNFTLTTLTSPPPVISSVASFPVGDTTATILWTTDVNATSQVNYGTTASYGSQTPLVSTLGLYHNVPLTGLTPGTTYHYQVISKNAGGGSSTSADFSFTTTGTAPVVFTNVTATGITSTSATISWTTNVPSSTQVFYGTTTSYGTLSSLNSALVTAHSVTLTGLTAGTTYNYEALSNTASSNGTSTNFTFATTGGAAPTLSAVTATNLAATSATITWTTDQPSTSQVAYGLTPSYGSQSALDNTLVTSHSVNLTGLTAGTTYNFAAISKNASSQTGTSVNFTFTTPTGAAAVISAVQATAIGASSATITWTTDQPTTSQVSYGTTTGYGSQSTLITALTTAHSVTLTGLAPGTTYNYKVTSTNSSNTTSNSGNFTFLTLSSPGPVISNVATYPVANTTATVLWVTDVNATSVVNYGTTTAYGQTSGPNSTLSIYHAVPLSGLTQGTTYNFQIVTTNASNVTTTSPNYTFTTSGVAPIVFTNVVASGITSTSATITWTTSVQATSQVAYGTTASYGSVSALNNAQLFAHSVVLTGLTPSTTYNFVALSTNGTAPNGASPNFTFTTSAGGPAPVISAVQATSITSTSATITWTTDQTSTSQVNYGPTAAYGLQSPLNSSLVTVHSVTLTGLTPGTQYNFDVVSTNGSNVSSTSSNFTFSTAAPAPPVISAVAATGITSTSATITWTTDQAASSQVNYGTTTSYGSQTPNDSSLVTSHSVTITGLTPGTTYNFDVVSANAFSTSSTSANSTFATTAASAPVISAVTTTGITTTSATITWTTDQPASSQVNYGTTASYGSHSTLNTSLVTSHSVTLTGLTPGTTYDFDVFSANAANTPATSSNFTFATTSVTAPVISAVTVTGITTTTATVTWTTDQAASSQVNYGATTSYGTQSPLNTTLVTSHSVTLTGLTPGTTYNYDVFSANASNTPATSANSTFSTASSSTPPPVISSVATYPVGDTTATILWATDVNSTSVVNYGTTTAYGQTANQGTAVTIYHAVPLTGLTPGTTYNFQIVSMNSSGVSATSGNFTFKTTGTAPAPGPVITNVVTSAITGTSATITWTTDQASTSQISYGPTTGYGFLSTLNTSLVTSHSVTLTGLTPGSTYNYSALSTNSTAVSSASPNVTFSTTGSVPSPVISSLAVWGISANGVFISWSTDQMANTVLAYGTTNALGQFTPIQTTLATSHGVNLTTLTSNTTYYIQAQSTNSSGSTGVSTIMSFTTLDNSAPTVLTTQASPAVGNSASVAWTLSKPGTCQVEYGTDLNYGWWSAQTANLSTPLGWVPSGTIHYRIHCVDAASNASVSNDFTFVEP